MLALLAQKFRPRGSATLSILIVSLLSLLLAGCINVQSNIILHGQGQWNGVTAIQIGSEFAEMMEQGNTSTTENPEGGETSVDTEGLDEFLENARESAGRDDFNVTFNEVKGEDGSLNYIIQGNGQEYNSLNEVFFNGDADISTEVVNGQRQITIRAEIDAADQTGDGGSEQTTPEDLAMMKAFGLGITYRISGDQIISSNATRVEGNTAIWEFPTFIEITLTEAAEFSAGAIALAEPPADSGFSPSAFEALMEGLAEDLQSTGQDTSDTITLTDDDTSTNEAQTESVSGESMADAAESSETTPAEMAEDTGDSADSSMNIVTEEDDTATTSSAEAQSLPASGGILPARTSFAQIILAGLVLGLLGVGAAIGLVNKETE